MKIIEYIVYGVALLWVLSWVWGIRRYTKRGTPPSPLTVNETMLFVVCLAIVPAMSLSSLHLLWMIPVAFLVGMLSLIFPFSLLSIPVKLFYRIACLGIDFDLARKNQERVNKAVELVRKENLSPDDAFAKVLASEDSRDNVSKGEA